ncbi:hypothetical protein AAC387_Pa03g4495 [Persea americana]
MALQQHSFARFPLHESIVGFVHCDFTKDTPPLPLATMIMWLRITSISRKRLREKPAENTILLSLPIPSDSAFLGRSGLCSSDIYNKAVFLCRSSTQ